MHSGKHIGGSVSNSASNVSLKNRINKIFVIGFNKCGTRSIHHLLQKNRLKSFHVGPKWRKLDEDVCNNRKLNRKLLYGYEDYCVFSDTSILQKEYKTLDAQYPNSLFILNTRDKLDWMVSRLNHRAPRSDGESRSYIRFMNRKNKTQLSWEEWVCRWSKEWDYHHSDTSEYFKDRSNDFLIFYIHNNPKKIKTFLKIKTLDLKFWGQRGITPNKRKYFCVNKDEDGNRFIKKIKDNYPII